MRHFLLLGLLFFVANSVVRANSNTTKIENVTVESTKIASIEIKTDSNGKYIEITEFNLKGQSEQNAIAKFKSLEIVNNVVFTENCVKIYFSADLDDQSINNFAYRYFNL